MDIFHDETGLRIGLRKDPRLEVIAILIARSPEEWIAEDRGAIHQNRVRRQTLPGEVRTVEDFRDDQYVVSS